MQQLQDSPPRQTLLQEAQSLLRTAFENPDTDPAALDRLVAGLRRSVDALERGEEPADELAQRFATRALAWREAILAETFTAPQVAEFLGTTRQTPHDRRRANSLLGIKDKGIWHFPTWQFDPHGPDYVLKGLPEVLKAFDPDLDDMIKARWLTSPGFGPDGRTPLDALHDGEVETVAAAARAVE